jgi:hypothetical protein
LAESENFGSGLSSRMSDNEHTAASLGHSEPLSVKHPPDHAIPEVNERGYDGCEISTTSRREEPGNILTDNPAGIRLSNEPVELPPERATVRSQSSTFACH